MGRLFVVEERPLPSRLVVPVPGVFRFADINPITGLSYALSRYGDLPLFAAWVVSEPVNLEPGEWDLIVGDGETAEWIDLDRAWPMPAGTRFHLDRCGRVHRTPAGWCR